MIPRTFPSVFGTAGETKMVVYVLPSITGLQAWKDYIPVKGVTSESNVLQNTYNNGGYQVMNALDSITGKQAWKDYIPVYEDAAYNKPWSTDAGGYIPGAGLFSVLGSLFANNEQGAWYDPSDIDRYMSDLGPELVTNGDFSNGTTGWSSGRSAVFSVTNSVATIANGASDVGYISQAYTTVVGKTYKATATFYNPAGGSPGGQIYIDSTPGNFGTAYTVAASGTVTLYFTAKVTTTYISVVAATGTPGASIQADNISVRELTTISTATLFQDSAGTTPVTAVEQPVGLVLDKRKGLVLGSDVVVNGSFATDTVWSKGTGWTITGGAAVGVNAGNMAQAGILTIGKWYRADVTVSVYTSGTLVCGTISNQKTLPSGTGVKTVYFLADATTFYFVGGSSFNGSVDVVTVRELPGNHAYQSTSASRPVLSARVNLLTKTEQFDDAAWTKSNVTVTSNATTAPDGTNTASLLTRNGTAVYPSIQRSVSSGAASTFSICVKAGTESFFSIHENGTYNQIGYFDLSAGTATKTSPSGNVSVSITSLGSGWYRCTASRTDAATWSLWIYGGKNNFATDWTDGETLYIWGADLRVANTGVNLPAYQRVNTATDYDTVGFPKYLKFDGVDDFLVTNSIDFTAGDKMTVVAGVRKLSDAAAAILVELSANWNTNNGSFSIQAPPAAASQYYFVNKGTIGSATQPSGYAAPITNILTGIGDISGDSNVFRVNGTQAASSTSDQGTGNYGNYPLYIGRRGGTSLPFNGHLYGLIMRGAASSAFQISGAEKYMNGVTKAY